MENQKTLEIPVYLDTEKIKSLKNTGEIIKIDEQYYTIPILDNGFIDIPDKTTSVTFTLTNKEGTDGTQFWLTSFDTTKGPIVDGKKPNHVGKNQPANVLTISVEDHLSKGATQTFTLDCYFLIYRESQGRNEVFHCSIDPKLKVHQGSGGGGGG